ncbi:MAG TPA: 1-deoxy-D-xylulose-5-phosphate synthase [Candidatus Udaeobacter sp.]|jgi:1-deoxy-D-xylulose-5-phosphate synthase|nr:1-deoxy-D-xylulose-5-phosphate synthase [Candidatus Udaeobacter sp.]
MSLLEQIHSPADLKKLHREELEPLAEEIRHAVIQTVARRAGHLAPNLGVVELTIALHRVFDSPTDKIIWDVGHQSYPHKLLTGRFEQFDTLRTLGGIAGYPRRDESEHDPFGTSHGSTSISAALGFAVARDLKGESHHVIAVIGDGALTGGMAFEGLNNAGELKRRLIVILNDNEHSISPNIGAIHRYLTKLTTSRIYRRFEHDVWELLGGLPKGRKAQSLAGRVKEGLQNLVVPTVLFEELGLKYFGPIDGHDLDVLEETLSDLKRFHEPVLLHVMTQKGRGYAPAEKDARTFHGVGVFDPETGTASKGSKKTYTQVFGEAALLVAERMPNAVAVTAAMTDNTGLKTFAEKYPERFFDVGMAEEHAVTFSGGLAAEGLVPLTTIYSTFLQRAFDQIIHDVAAQNLKIVLCIDRAGLVGEDGAPQHGVFDVGYLRMIPGVVVMQPKNGEELRDMIWTAAQWNGHAPIAVRYPRTAIPDESIPDREPRLIEIGRAEQLRAGGDVALIAFGTMVLPALAGAERMAAAGVSATVVNARFAAPVDERMIAGLARSVGRLITVEESILSGGFGSAVSECLDRLGLSGTPLLRLALPDEFVTHGRRDELLQKVQLDPAGIATRALEWIAIQQRQFT